MLCIHESWINSFYCVVSVFLTSFVSRRHPIVDWNGVCNTEHIPEKYTLELHKFCQIKQHVFKWNRSWSSFLIFVCGYWECIVVYHDCWAWHFTYVLPCSSTYFVPLRPLATRDPEGSQSCQVLLLDDICVVACGTVQLTLTNNATTQVWWTGCFDDLWI